MNKSTTQLYGEPAPVYGGHQAALAAFRGHRFAEGEGGAPPASPAPTPPAPTPPPAPPVPSPPPTPTTPPTPQETFSRDYVHELREEAKANRVSHQAAEARATTAETALAEAQAQLATMHRNTAIRDAAKDIANADLLLDSASFTQSIEQVDPADTAAITAAIQAFVEKNSAYGPPTTIPGSSGGTPTGGTNTQPTTLDGAVAAHYAQ